MKNTAKKKEKKEMNFRRLKYKLGSPTTKLLVQNDRGLRLYLQTGGSQLSSPLGFC